MAVRLSALHAGRPLSPEIFSKELKRELKRNKRCNSY
jgi:hypothetical protein